MIKKNCLVWTRMKPAVVLSSVTVLITGHAHLEILQLSFIQLKYSK
jgi:hypothetical protein